MPLDLSFNCDIYSELFFSASDCCGALSQLFGLCSSVGGSSQYLHSKQMAISCLLGLLFGDDNSALFPRMGGLRSDDRCSGPQRKDKHFFFRQEVIQGVYPLI